MTGRVLCAILLSAACAAAQVPEEFEVASVKPQAPDDTRVSIRPAPGGFIANGIPLKHLIQVAWGLKDFQVSGGPGWMETDRYDISAKAAEGVIPTHEQTKAMLRALLTDRFSLKVHRETRNLPAFALVVNKGVPKLKRAAPPSKEDKYSGPWLGVSGGMVTGQRIDMAELADALATESDRTVVDETGLSGTFDLTLKWNPEAAGQDMSAVSLFTAIQEQLGLKLKSTKAPVEILVIDSAEKASAN